MKIIICGLGYVGVTVAACMLRKGANVVAVDISAQKVEITNSGRSPVKEPGVEEIFAIARNEHRLLATTTLGDTLLDADMVITCVGTPSRHDGTVELSHVLAISTEIG